MNAPKLPSMKFTADRTLFLDAVSIAARVATGSTAARVYALSGVKLSLAGNELRVLGSDHDLTMFSDIEVAGGDDGELLVPARLLADIVKSIPSDRVDVVAGESSVEVSGGPAQFTIQMSPLDPDDPVWAMGEGEISKAHGESIRAEALTQALTKVVKVASKDDSRPLLTGVLMEAEGETLRLVATDTFRLAKKELHGTTLLGERERVLVPGRALDELLRLLKNAEQVVLRFDEQQARFEVDNVCLITRLLTGDFPDYRAVIPDPPHTIRADRAVLVETVRRVGLMAQESSTVTLDPNKKRMDVVAQTQDVGSAEESVEVARDGEKFKVAFNHDYLASGLDALDGETVEIALTDSVQPSVIRDPEDDSYLYLLMPVRLR